MIVVDPDLNWVLKQFKIQCEKAGIRAEIMRRRAFVKPGERRRNKAFASRLRRGRA